MNDYSEPSDDLEECVCMNCKGIFWVPYYEGLSDIGHPAGCPFCMLEFGLVIDVSEGQDEERN